jgi:hypothetical protein
MLDLVLLTVSGVAMLGAIVRLSWSARGAGIAAAAVALGSIPLFLGDHVASLSQERVRAWLLAPENGKTLSLLVVAESLVAGTFSLRVLSGWIGPRLRTVLATLPAPCLIVAMMGTQMLLFNTVSGVDFTALSWCLGILVAVALGAGAWLARRFWSVERRAEVSVRLAVCQFLVGACLPQLILPPRPPPGVGAIDARSTLLVPVSMLAVVAIGPLRRWLGRPRADSLATPPERNLA